MPRALVNTVAYSLAKINECIDFVELNRMAFYSGQKPKSALSWTLCITKILSLAANNRLNHNSSSTQWRNSIVCMQFYREKLEKKKKLNMALLWTRDMHHWRAVILSMQEQYSNSEPEVASVFGQLETDNRSIMFPQHSNNKQSHMPQVNKTSILSHTWHARGDG